MTFCDLKQKEVINICTCKSLGCPADLKFDHHTGCITALVIAVQSKGFGFFSPCEELIIPWNCVTQIGEDIILVKIQENTCSEKK